jgi:hypothetical protein
MSNFMNKIGGYGTIAFVIIASVIYFSVFGSEIDLVPKQALEGVSAKFRTLSFMITQPLNIIAIALFFISELFISSRIDLNKRNGVCGFSRIHASILVLLLLASFVELVMALGNFVFYEYSRYILEELIDEVIWLGVVIALFILNYPVIKYAFKRSRN